MPQKLVCIFGSARLSENSPYYAKAKELSSMLASSGYSILSGGGGGIMKAANEGAAGKNTHSIGLNIKLPFEQDTNEFVSHKFTFKSFSSRKFALIDSSLAFVVFPGGFGTLDELFEVLTLTQTGFKKSPIFLYGEQFWAGLDSFIKNTLQAQGLISKEDLELYCVTDNLEFIKDKISHI
ncbi:TIGR00730 family Rossman fold protein [Campylobacter sp. 19-13652]|uniref:LOG family protein n=1 Tax=Campylobacter sp. 19-13652 TaxID=2840180 RepID=UPI001C840D43